MRWHPRLELDHEVWDVEDGYGQEAGVSGRCEGEVEIGLPSQRCGLLAGQGEGYLGGGVGDVVEHVEEDLRGKRK